MIKQCRVSSMDGSNLPASVKLQIRGLLKVIMDVTCSYKKI